MACKRVPNLCGIPLNDRLSISYFINLSNFFVLLTLGNCLALLSSSVFSVIIILMSLETLWDRIYSVRNLIDIRDARFNISATKKVQIYIRSCKNWFYISEGAKMKDFEGHHSSVP